jgi:hypothetical protein
MQRVKDAERFEFELNRPPPGRAGSVTAADLDRDGASFMAFAAAVGVAPTLAQAPRPGNNGVTSPDGGGPATAQD